MPPEKKPTQTTQLALMLQDLDGIRRDITEIKQDIKSSAPMRSDIKSLQDGFVSLSDTLRVLRESTVTKDQFWPVKTIVYGGVGLMLTAIIGALMAVVLARAP